MKILATATNLLAARALTACVFLGSFDLTDTLGEDLSVFVLLYTFSLVFTSLR